MTPKQAKEFKNFEIVLKALIAEQQQTTERLAEAEEKLAALTAAIASVPVLEPAAWHDLSAYKTPKVEYIDSNFDALKKWADAVAACLRVGK